MDNSLISLDSKSNNVPAKQLLAADSFKSGRTWQDYLSVILKYRWLSLGTFLLIVSTAILYAFLKTPIYKATTQIFIEREIPNIFDNNRQSLISSPYSHEFYSTQYTILEGQALAKKVIEKLHVQSHPSYGWIFKYCSAGGNDSKERCEAEELLLTTFMKNVKVFPMRNSHLVDLSFYDSDPQFAALVANTMGQSYVEQVLEMHFGASRQTVDWLKNNLAEARQKLEESEAKLNKYTKDHQIIVSENKDGIATQKLEQLNRALVAAQTRRIEAKALYDQVIKGKPVYEIVNNPIVQALKPQEAKVLGEQSELAIKYGEKHPRMIMLNNELVAIRGNIKNETKRVAQSIINQYQIAFEQEEKLKAALEDQKTVNQDLGDRKIPYQVLMRDVQANRALYESMLKSLKETTVTQNTPATNIRVVNPASVPTKPIKPRKLIILSIAPLIGLLTACGLAFALETWDNSLKSPQDVETWLKIPNLVTVPHFQLPGVDDAQNTKEIVIFHPDEFLASESYRGLRTQIIFSSNHDARIIQLTSTQPLEGKTTTVINLAAVLSTINEPVLMVDADLRRSKLHKIMNVKREPGLSNFLSGDIDYIPSIKTMVPNLHLVSAGSISDNPSELLSNERLIRFLQMAKDQFAWIIIDSPPLLAVSDSAILSTHAEGVILVVKADAVSRRSAQEAINHLMKVNAKILGVVFNDVPIRPGSYNYYYSNYYYNSSQQGRNAQV
jgi:succinoglycan biosynthesis transport protein ExoP